MSTQEYRFKVNIADHAEIPYEELTFEYYGVRTAVKIKFTGDLVALLEVVVIDEMGNVEVYAGPQFYFIWGKLDELNHNAEGNAVDPYMVYMSIEQGVRELLEDQNYDKH